MNRKERRQMSKKLGILQHQQKLSLYKKFELIRENISQGKERQKEFEAEVEKSINSQISQKESDIIYSIAEKLAKDKNIPMIDAMELAQREYRLKIN